MVQRLPDAHQRRINDYVPAMAYASDVVHNGLNRIDFGAPNVADPNGILAAAAADDSGPYTYTPANFATTTEVDAEGVVKARYGRCLTVDGSAAGVTQDITIVGRDYLGQPIKITTAMTGTTVKAINVAFKYIDSITIAVGASGETIDVGWSDILGVPYKTIKVL